MGWLYENPTPVIAGGILIELLLALVFYQTGRRVVLVLMAAVLAMGLGLLALERMVVTDEEAISDTFDALAQALEANDVAGVLSHLEPPPATVQGEAQSAMSMVEIRSVKLRNVKISVDRATNPPTAHVDLNALFSLEDRSGRMPYENSLQAASIELRKSGQSWLITGYQLREPELGGFR